MNKTTSTQSILCLCGDRKCIFQFGYCHCKCGGKTEISLETRTLYRAKKGLPKLFLPHHHLRMHREEWGLDDDPDVGHLPLGRNRFAVVDAHDYERLKSFSYYAKLEKNNEYAARDSYDLVRDKKVRRIIRLHWDVLHKPPRGRVIDHINQNGLDNRRENLRECSNRENGHNHRLSKRNKSGHSGVCFNKAKQSWDVSIGVDGRSVYLGRFRKSQKEKAIECRRAAELKYYGDYAPRLNPDEENI